MTQEEKVREIANAPIEDLGEDVDSFFYKLCKKSYNLGIQEAADNVKFYKARAHIESKVKWKKKIDKESILKLKI